MPLFPQLGPQYITQGDRPILQRMEAFYAESISINQAFWSEASIDTRFYSGDQSLWNDLYGNVPVNRRRQFNFNRIRRTVSLVEGHQRRNRKSIIVTPVENGDNETADQFSKVMLWCCNQENVLNTISDSFTGSLITGMNLLQVWLDFRSDPVSGNIKVDNCSYNSFLIDPFFRKADLSDCNHIWKRSFLTKRECISLLPDKQEDLLDLIGNSYSPGRDGKFQYMPESYNWSMTNLLTYDEFYYRDYRSQKMLVDTKTGETMEWKSEDKSKLDEFLRSYPEVIVTDQEVPTVRLAIVVQGKVMYDGPQPIGIDQYPFVPVLGYYTPELESFEWRIQGIVRGLRDAQYLYNRRKVIELDILESQINSGYKYKENALVNPKDIFLTGQGRGLALKEEAQMTDVEQIIAPAIPASMIQLSELLGQEINQISGVNEELLGSANDEKAGILAMLRQGAGLTTLQRLFDQLDQSTKLLGKLMLDIIQTNFTPGKIKKILEGQEPMPQFYNKAFGRYDVVVEEGLNTSTQKQMNFAQLLQLKELGLPIPDDVMIEESTLQNKKHLTDAIAKAQQQQQQMMQMQMQSQIEEQQARVNLSNARAVADQGLGLERLSRVEENKSLAIERRAAAHRDEDEALLTLAKALKEMDSIELEQIEKLLHLANLMKNGVDSVTKPEADVAEAAIPR